MGVSIDLTLNRLHDRNAHHDLVGDEHQVFKDQGHHRDRHVFEDIPEQDDERLGRPVVIENVIDNDLVVFQIEVISLDVGGVNFDADPISVEAQMASQD